MDGVFRGWVQRVKAIIYVFPFLQQLEVQIYIRVSLWWVGGIQRHIRRTLKEGKVNNISYPLSLSLFLSQLFYCWVGYFIFMFLT